MMGVAWNGPGRVPYSSRGISFGSHRQTTSRSPTLAAVISSAAEYLVCAGSEPTYCHSIMPPGSPAPARALDTRATVATNRFMGGVLIVNWTFVLSISTIFPGRGSRNRHRNERPRPNALDCLSARGWFEPSSPDSSRIRDRRSGRCRHESDPVTLLEAVSCSTPPRGCNSPVHDVGGDSARDVKVLAGPGDAACEPLPMCLLRAEEPSLQGHFGGERRAAGEMIVLRRDRLRTAAVSLRTRTASHPPSCWAR